MKIFFYGNFVRHESKTYLLSIGFEAENKRFFYGECSDYFREIKFDTSRAETWVRDNILKTISYSNNPQHGPNCSGVYNGTNECIPTIPNAWVMGDYQMIKSKLLEWFKQFDEVELWGYDPYSYWFAIPDLIAINVDGERQFPRNFLHNHPFDIKTMLVSIGEPDIPMSEMSYNARYHVSVIRRCYESVKTKIKFIQDKITKLKKGEVKVDSVEFTRMVAGYNGKKVENITLCNDRLVIHFRCGTIEIFNNGKSGSITSVTNLDKFDFGGKLSGIDVGVTSQEDIGSSVIAEEKMLWILTTHGYFAVTCCNTYTNHRFYSGDSFDITAVMLNLF